MTSPGMCSCGNCDWVGSVDDVVTHLTEIKDLAERLDPGSEVPVGECPKCRCLAYQHLTTRKIARDTDYVLDCGNVWITVKHLSVRVHETDEGVVVDIWPLGREEDDDILASCYAFFAEAEAEAEGDDDE